MEHLNVFFWRQRETLGNFGDALTIVFLSHLFKGECLYPNHSVHLIGSVISPEWIQAASDAASDTRDYEKRALFWACGKRDDQPIAEPLLRRCTFLGVRGALTRDALGLPRSTPLGDSALLLPRIYQPKHDPEAAGKVLWVPHFHYGDPSEQDLDGCPPYLVKRPSISNTVEACESFIDAIVSARFVMANAMHAAVVALAYGTPFAFWPGTGINVPFKWRDFTSAFGMQLEFYRTFSAALTAFNRTRPDRAFAELDLTPLLEIAPYRLREVAVPE